MSMKATFQNDRPRKKPCAPAALLLLAGLLLALAPLPLLAQEAPFATAVLYEIREDVNCNPGPAAGNLPDCSNVDARGFGTRIADATLSGWVWGPVDSAFNGAMQVEAASILSKVDWTGPAHGKINVNNGAVHGVFSGQLNLSLAMLGGKPLAPISGTWRGTKGTLSGGGQVEGVFLIPFQLPGQPELGWFYLEVDAAGHATGNVIPLKPGECVCPDPAIAGDFHNGIPMVKLLVSFFNK